MRVVLKYLLVKRWKRDMLKKIFEDKKLLIANILFFVVTFAFDIGLLITRNGYVFKTIASVLFVICGLVNFIVVYKHEKNSKLYGWFMLTGLVFACAGDILLIESSLFIYGAISFAIGHVFFFVAYSTLYKINWKDILISLGIFAVALVVILAIPVFEFDGMLPVVIIYALVISFMLGKAISNFAFCKENKIQNLIIMIGSILFFLSDLMLLFNVFSNIVDPYRIFDIICLVLYYPAEILLATSIYYSNRKIEQSEEVKN